MDAEPRLLNLSSNASGTPHSKALQSEDKNPDLQGFLLNNYFQTVRNSWTMASESWSVGPLETMPPRCIA